MPAKIIKLNKSAELRMNEINKIRACKEEMDKLELRAIELSNRKGGEESLNKQD